MSYKITINHEPTPDVISFEDAIVLESGTIVRDLDEDVGIPLHLMVTDEKALVSLIDGVLYNASHAHHFESGLTVIEGVRTLTLTAEASDEDDE